MTIDISESNVRQTVRFGRTVLGQDLIDAVRATCAAEGSSFSETKRYDDGWLHAVGRSSHSEYENVLVTPDRENPYIDPKKSYTEAVVLRHGVGGGTRTLARFSVEREVEATVKFAQDLQRTVEYGPAAGQATERGRDADVQAQSGPDWGRREGSGYRIGGSTDLTR